MRIFIPHFSWVGNFFQYLKSGFEDIDLVIGTNNNKIEKNQLIQKLKLHQISKIRVAEEKRSLFKYNQELLKQCLEFNPDLFLVFNESMIYPDTIEKIKLQSKCIMACIVADDPWDSIRYRADFPHSLKYFDFIFTSDPIWNINIVKVAPKAKIYWHTLGFDPEIYYTIGEDSISENDRTRFSCDISFTGTSYGPKAEGAYRSDILSYLTDYDLKIWGDDNWPYRFKYLPQLKDCYKGTRLPYDDLRKLYHLTKINLNLPAPQILTGFQPRIFEIAACKGFQIIDYRPLIDKVFDEDELVTFKTIGELKEKANYYLSHETERMAITEKLYKKVTEKYTWKNWAQQILDTIAHPENYEQL